MKYSIQEFEYQHALLEDAELVLELAKRCEIAEYGEHDSDLEDLLHDWGSTDLSHDSWLVHTPDGQLIGYGIVMPWFGSLRYDFFVDPCWDKPDLGIDLLQRCEQRAQVIAGQSVEEIPEIATCYIAHVNHRDRSSLEACGFELLKYHFQMRIQMEYPIPPVKWPPGIAMRNMIPGQDDKEVHQLIEVAFARPDRVPSNLEYWQSNMMRADIFDPELWFLAFDDAEIVGACLCFKYPEEGWVRQLAVHPRWQGKGLGSALLRHAFHVFQFNSHDKVGLTVDAENENAYIFYQRLGMQRVRQYEQHEKSLLAS